MRNTLFLVMAVFSCRAQPPAAETPKLKSREEAAAPKSNIDPGALLVVPAATKIPIQLRQPVSTKNAQVGDAIYAQTSFPILINGVIAVPAGTWVQGVVDAVKRAGRIKGTAELQFHLTAFIYPNGYSVDIAAAIDQVPGAAASSVKEGGVVKQDSEKGKDLQRVGEAAGTAGQIGALTGAAVSPSIRGFGVGGLAGIAAGTLIGVLTRGTDVRFDTGTAIEISLSKAMAVDRVKASEPGAAR